MEAPASMTNPSVIWNIPKCFSLCLCPLWVWVRGTGGTLPNVIKLEKLPKMCICSYKPRYSIPWNTFQKNLLGQYFMHVTIQESSENTDESEQWDLRFWIYNLLHNKTDVDVHEAHFEQQAKTCAFLILHRQCPG